MLLRTRTNDLFWLRWFVTYWARPLFCNRLERARNTSPPFALFAGNMAWCWLFVRSGELSSCLVASTKDLYQQRTLLNSILILCSGNSSWGEILNSFSCVCGSFVAAASEISKASSAALVDCYELHAELLPVHSLFLLFWESTVAGCMMPSSVMYYILSESKPNQKLP